MGRTLLERWLSQRVGYCVRLDANDVGRALYDGRVFYDLLKSYGVVNIDMFGGIPGRRKKTPDEAFRSLSQLCDAFRLLDIPVNKDYLKGIANQSGPYAVRLLYQLYLQLQDKQFLDLLTSKKEDPYSQGTKKLLVELSKTYHKRDLVDGAQAAKEMTIMKQYDDARRQIVEHCAKDFRKRRELLQRAQNQLVSTNYKAGGEPQCLAEFLRAAAEEQEEETIELDPHEYIESIKIREEQRRNEDYKKFKAMPREVVDVWADILKTMNNESQRNFKERMNQQSTYEKYQARKWSGAHDKFKRFFTSRLCKYVDSDEEDDGHAVKNAILRRGGDNIAKKQEPEWSLHQKLWDKRIRQRKRCNYEMARHIVQDLMNILMKVLLYRHDHKRAPVPRTMMNDWKEEFFKGTLTEPPPRVTLVDNSIEYEEALPEEDIVMDRLPPFDSKIFIDREVVRLLNEFNVHCYLYLVGPWDMAKWPESEAEEEDLTINGFIVHRLLETKYPLPKGYQDPKFNFKFTAALSSIKDPNTAYIYNTMRSLLAKSKVVALDIIEPMNHCLNMYHAETEAILEVEAEVTEQEAKKSAKRASRTSKVGGKRKSSLKRNSSLKAKSSKPADKKEGEGEEMPKKAGSGRKSMGARKSTGGRKSTDGNSVVSRKSMGGRKSGGGGKSITGKRKSMAAGGKLRPSKGHSDKQQNGRANNKAMQCPSIDELILRVNHSPAGLLGKEAFYALTNGKPISDLLSGKMLIEYLQMKKDSIEGLALISYPLNVSQAVLLEFLMTGRPLKTDYKINPEIDKFIQDELRPQPYLDTRLLVDFEEILSPDLLEISQGILETLADKWTANFITEHHRPVKKTSDLDNINAGLTVLEQGLPKEVSKKGPDNIVVGSSNVKTQTQAHKILETGTGPGKENAHYPDWLLFSYNTRTPKQEELVQRLRTATHNLGRFRPMLSTESYEKLKAHVFELMAWLRPKTKYREKTVESQEIFDEVSEEGGEDKGSVVVIRPLAGQNNSVDANAIYSSRPPLPVNVDNVKTLVAMNNTENYRRPISYVDLLKLRSSEILPRPNKDDMEIHYGTSSFFQKYIKCLPNSAARKEEEDYKAKKLKYEKCMTDEVPGEECVLDRIMELEPDTYYKVYGKKEVCSFDSPDYDFITKLCRMILNQPWEEDDPLRKMSAILFDDEVLKKLMKDLPSKKGTKSKRGTKSGRKSSVGRKSAAGRKSATGRKNTASGKFSAGRKNAAGRKSAAGGAHKSAGGGARKSAVGGARKSAAGGARKSAAGRARKSAAGKSADKNSGTRRNTTAIKGKTKEDRTKPGKEKIEPIEEKLPEEKEAPLPPPPPPPPPPPKPGEKAWEYIEQPISEIYQIYLATTWESIEFEYLSNLIYLFYLMRSHDLKVMPYSNFIEKEMESALLHTDNRMEKVAAFQKIFNKIQFKIGMQSEVKRKLHCQIYALYNDLVGIADAKRSAAMTRRDDLLNQRWVPKHIFAMANLFLNLMQIETNRTIQSLQLIHDYYFAMMEKPPPSNRLEMFTVPRVNIPHRVVSMCETESSNPETKPIFPWMKAKEEVKTPEYILGSLNNLENLLWNSAIQAIDPNPAHPLIRHGIESSKAKADEVFDFYEHLILDPEFGKELRPKILQKMSPEEEKERRRQEKAFRKMLMRRRHKDVPNRSLSEDRHSRPPKIRKKKPKKDTDDEDEGEGAEVVVKTKFYMDASKLQMVDRLKWEWLVAIKGEVNRLKFRLDLIQNRAEADLDEVLSIFKNRFDEFSHDIGWQYRREIKAIDEVLGMLRAATNMGVNIHVPMILKNDQFYVGKYPKNELSLEVPPPPNSPVFIIPKEFNFTLAQLNNFVRKIEDVAPDGIIDRCFIDIIEDMAAFNVEMNFEFLPPGWSELNRSDIRFLIEQAFGPNLMVNWRDFLLFCTSLRYPTVEELVEMRVRFREADKFRFENIQYTDYMEIPLWYEKDLKTEEDFAWGQEIKKLLFTLFRTSRKEINYTELLLNLCKGKDPEDGFGKALSLMVGVGFIFWPDPPDWVHPRHVVDYVLIQILHDAIIKADYATITDYVPEEAPLPVILDEEETGEEPEEMEEVEAEEEEEVSEELEEKLDKYKQILWRTCVPFEACMALLLVALRFWELPSSHLIRQIDVETRLRNLFKDQGVGSHMKAYRLAQSNLIREIFHSTSAFKECNMPELVYNIVKSKQHVVGAKGALEEQITNNIL